MIRATLHPGWPGSPVTRPSEPPCEGSAGRMAMLPDRLSGGAPADRLCAWAGRSGRRLVFAVTRLDPARGPADVPLGPGTLVLAVHRPAGGPRRVLWAASVETEATASAIRTAAAGLARCGGGELHCRVAADPNEAVGLAADFAARL